MRTCGIYFQLMKLNIDQHLAMGFDENVKSCLFQFLFLHRLKVNNVFLHKTGLVNTPNCTFCKQDLENCYSPTVQLFSTFGKKLKSGLASCTILTSTSRSMLSCLVKVMFEPNLFVNYLIILGKQYIYKCK